MIKNVLFALFAIIFLITLNACAQSVLIYPSVSYEKKVKPYEFTTISFTIDNKSDTEYTFSVKLDVPEQIELVSKLSNISVIPFSKTKIPLTLMIDGSIQELTELPVVINLTSLDKPYIKIKSEIKLLMESEICLNVSNLPDVLYIKADTSTSYIFGLENCGNSQQEFKVKISTGKNVLPTEVPNKIVLKSKESRNIQFSLVAGRNQFENESHVNIKVFNSGFHLYEKSINTLIDNSVSDTKVELYKYINLKVNYRYLHRSDSSPGSNLYLSVPSFQEREFALKSNVSFYSERNKLEESSSLHEISYKYNFLKIGNQNIPTSSMLINNRNFVGLSFMKQISNYELSLFNGENSTGDIGVIRFQNSVDSSLTYGTELVKSNFNSNIYEWQRSTSIHADYKVNENLLINPVFTIASTKFIDDENIKTGNGLKINSIYTDNKFQLSIGLQSGSKSFFSGRYQKGIELSTEYKSTEYKLFSKIVSSKKVHSIKDDLSILSIPYIYQSFSIGLSKHFKNSNTSITGYLSKTSYDQSSMINDFGTDRINRDSITTRISKKFKNLNMIAGVEFGNEKSASNKNSFREYEFSGIYEKRRFRTSLSFVDSIDFESYELDTRKSRRYSSIFSYKIPGNNVEISAGRLREIETLSFDTGSTLVKQIFSIDAILSKKDRLNLKYELFKRHLNNEKVFSATINRVLDIKIPYKKNGTMKGRVYIDADRNGVFGNSDIPLSNTNISLSNTYHAKTDRNGNYNIKGIDSDTYSVVLDKLSYPVGLIWKDEKKFVKIKSGRNELLDIPLTYTCRISGNISVDNKNYFTRFSEINSSQIRLYLEKNGEYFKETFSSKNGEYYFEEVPPGIYKLVIDHEWLRSGETIIGAKYYYVDCGILLGENSRLSGKLFNMTGLIDFVNFDLSSIDTILIKQNTNYDYYVNCDQENACGNNDFKIGIKTKKIKKTFRKM